MIAVLLAGGSGSRMQSDTPKQFLPLADGRSILEHSVEAFNSHEAVDEICIVMNPDWIDATNALVAKNGWSKVKHVVPGGAERYLSSLAAIECFLDRDDDDFFLLLHDAARPFVSPDIIIVVAAPIETPCTTIVSAWKVFSQCSTSSRSFHPIWMASPSLSPQACSSGITTL